MNRRHWAIALLTPLALASGGCKRRGNDDASGSSPARPAAAPTQATQVAIGGSSACALLANGTVQCWGDNSYGQLGDGTRENRLTPVAVQGLTNALQVDVGDAHACARKSDGTVWCWGSGSDGATGTGSSQNTTSPALVAGLPPVQDIGTSGGNTCAVANDGGVWCWGANAFGESAQPAGTRRVPRPTRVAGLGPAAEVDTGQNHTCARLRDGTVWCWGYNSSGQLGDGTSEQRYAPVQAAGVTGATALAVGQNHNCALIAGGAVTCWGSTGGAGGGRQASTVAVAGATALTAGNYSTCATVGGVPKCWGQNYEGKLRAPRETSAVREPTPLPGVAGVREVALGVGYQCAVAAAGPVRCWGTLRRPFQSRSVIRTADIYPVTFDGHSPAPPMVPDPSGQGGNGLRDLANAVQGAADAAAQAVNAAQGAVDAAVQAAADATQGGTPSRDQPLATRAAATTAVTANPADVTVGRSALHAERCALGGPPVLGSSASAAMSSIAFDRRGALYLVDGEQHLRKYLPTRGDACAFEPDASFGQAGVLALPTGVTHVSADRRGDVIASGVTGSYVVHDGGVAARCARPSHGYVTAGPRPGEGFGIFPGSPVRHVTYEGDACSVEPWTYENAFQSVMALALDRRDVIVAGSMPNRGGNYVAVYDPRGRERARFGNARATADDGFCWVHDVTPCDAGYCVVDTNCDRLSLWSRRGDHLGNARASQLFGLQRPWLSAISPGRRHEVYVATGAMREPRAASVAEGVLFRVTGL